MTVISEFSSAEVFRFSDVGGSVEGIFWTLSSIGRLDQDDFRE